MLFLFRINGTVIKKTSVQLSDHNSSDTYRVAQKSHYPIFKKSYYIVLKPVNDIRFIRKIKVSIKHYSIIRWY